MKRALAIAAFSISISFLLAQSASAQVIQTVAGGGPPDGAPATSANLNIPRGMVMDSSGNVFVAVQNAHRVIKITPGGFIFGYAGRGTRGFSGDGGPALNASLDSPYSLALDPSGNLYIGDNGNARVRRVDAVTGVITTIAGTGLTGFTGDGVATSSRISGANGLALDGDNLFIADAGNNRIRKVVLSTGIISTVAGSSVVCGVAVNPCGDGGPATSAQLNFPADVVVDGTGNLIFSDRNLRKIRRVDAMSGLISTIAGDGNFCSHPAVVCGDGGPATAAQLSTPHDILFDSAGNLFIIDDFLRRIRKLDMTTGILTKEAGGSNCNPCGDGGPVNPSGMDSPTHGLFTPAGDLLVSDGGLTRIRRLDFAANVITAFAGNGTVTFYGDGGPALEASIGQPGGIVLDSSGNILISDNNRIRRIDVVTGVITTRAGLGAFCASGTSPCGDGGSATNALFRTPFGLAFDSAGNLFIADINSFRIRRIDAVTNVITTVAGNGAQCTSGTCGDGGPAKSTGTGVGSLTALAFDQSGNLHLTDSLLRRIRRITPGADGLITGATDEIISTVVGTGGFGSGGDNGPALSAQLSFVRDLVFDSAGNLYLSDLNNHRIRMVTPGSDGQITGAADEIITTVAGNGTQGFLGDGGPATNARINGPRGLRFDSAGNLYFSDAANQRVRRVNAIAGAITPASTIETIAGMGVLGFFGDGGPATVAQLAVPDMMVMDALGRLLFADLLNFRIRRIQDPSNRAPVANAGPDQSLVVASSTTWPVTLDASATTEPDGDGLTYTWTGSFGTASGVSPTVNLPLGTSNVTLTVVDARGGRSVDTVVFTLTNTVTTVNYTPNPGVYGAQSMMQITVTSPLGIPTGTITAQFTGFGGTTISLVNGGNTLFSTVFTASGNSLLTVSYAGDGPFFPSKATVNTVVTKSDTSMTLTSSLNPSLTGQSVTFTARVFPVAPGGEPCGALGGPMGTIQFKVDGVNFGGPVTLPTSTCASNHFALLTTTALTQGTHTITAEYAGDTKYTGSSASLTQTVNSPDSTPPVITPNVTGTLGNNGWYTSNVGVSWNVMDAQSTVTSTTGCGASSVTSDTAGVTFTCSATSTGGTASQSVTIMRDATPPTAAIGGRVPAANAFGWNNTDVVVSFSGTDNLSGIANCSSAATVASEGANQSASGSCTDNAGNVSASVTENGINIDKIAPTASAAASPAPNGNGWNNTDITVTFAGNDALSGIDTCSASTILSADGAGQSASGTCTDKAGNTSATATASGINIDKTAPSAAAAASPAPNGNGWNNSDVTVAFAGTDALSGIDTCSVATVLSLDGAGQSASGICTDKAGNASAPATANEINIDKTAPVITFLGQSPAANGAGWNNSNVTANWSCADSTSGSVSAGASQSLTSEGSGQSAAGTCSDLAGNSVSHTHTGVNIDKTPPVINVAAPGNGAVYLFNSIVAADYSCADALSGAATCAGSVANGAPIATIPVGAHSFVVNATDVAGNPASVSVAYNVAPAPTAVNLTSDNNPSLFGVPVKFTANVSSVAAPGALIGGTITFKKGTTTLATVAITGGVATYTTSTLAIGNHSITALYNGDGNFLPSSSAAFTETISPSSALRIQFVVHTILDDSRRPRTQTVPVEGADVRVYTRKDNCTNGLVVTNQPKIWGKIFDGPDGPGGAASPCPIVDYGNYLAKGVTDANGKVTIIVPPTLRHPDEDYVIIGHTDDYDVTRTIEQPDDLYSGVTVQNARAGVVKEVALRRIRMFNGKRVPAKFLEEFGSYLAIIEPEYMEWTNPEELYPIVLVADGDWTVTTSVAPPEGFVPDTPQLSATVTDTTEAIQFTITDVGSSWTNTATSYIIKHKGETRVRVSQIPMFNRQPAALAAAAAGASAKNEHPQLKPYHFIGFLAPVVNVPETNDVKPGSTVRFEWQLLDSTGKYLTERKTFVSILSAPVACDAAAASIPEKDFEPAGTGDLKYDAAENRFVLLWNTERAWTGCRMAQITLTDGTKHFARFSFTAN